MDTLDVIELFAGTRPDGMPVVERLPVQALEGDKYQLIRSPAFIKGVARGDTISLEHDDRAFSLVKRSGNLSIKVIAKNGGIATLAEDLTPKLEKLGGQLDFENQRMLVYSIHVSCGFKNVENILNDHVGEETDSIWYYGNVYEPADGVTPLNWWHEILKPQ